QNTLMRCRGPGQWREYRLGTQVIPLYLENQPKDASRTVQLPLTEVVHRTTKSLTAKNAMPRLTEAIAAMVKEADSPTGRIREERFRNVLEERSSWDSARTVLVPPWLT
ncbi:unnamed protein product, partial [Durusdinium trenchii]